jgi:serine/threonine-protein kinase
VAPVPPDAAARIARALPAGYRPGTCTPTGSNTELAAAALSCGPNTDRGGPLTGTYTLARNATALRALFDHEVAAAAGVVCPGNIQSPGPWQRLANPTVPQGIVFCGIRDGRPLIAWTTNDRLLCATIEAESAGATALGQLYTWWTGHS